MHHFTFRIPSCILRGEEDVAALALSIVHILNAKHLWLTLGIELNTGRGRRQLDDQRSSPSDPDLALRGGRRSRLERRHQELGEQERSQAVCRQLKLIALREFPIRLSRPSQSDETTSAPYLSALAPSRRNHDPGVVGQHMQLLLSREEIVHGRLDGREVREIELQELKTAGRLGMGGFDLVNRFYALLLAASGDVDGAIAAVQ